MFFQESIKLNLTRLTHCKLKVDSALFSHCKQPQQNTRRNFASYYASKKNDPYYSITLPHRKINIEPLCSYRAPHFLHQHPLTNTAPKSNHTQLVSNHQNFHISNLTKVLIFIYNSYTIFPICPIYVIEIFKNILLIEQNIYKICSYLL